MVKCMQESEGPSPAASETVKERELLKERGAEYVKTKKMEKSLLFAAK